MVYIIFVEEMPIGYEVIADDLKVIDALPSEGEPLC
jgi:hypothetical protein